MNYLESIIQVAEIIIYLYLGLTAVYLLFFALMGLFTKSPKQMQTEKIRKIAVLIPGYKEDNVIVDVAQKALIQDYPKEAFEIIIIADSFSTNTVEQLKQLPLRVVEVNFEVSTKAKALNKAMEVI